jgi:hypothetical protein
VAYAAKAAGLAAPDDPTAVAREARWQLGHASPTVREILRRLPPPPHGHARDADQRHAQEAHSGRMALVPEVQAAGRELGPE